MIRGAIALVAIAASGCAPRPGPSAVPAGDGPLVATYRAEIQAEGDKTRRAKLLLWAERPDRLHAELLPPAGGSPVILDAGGGRAVLVADGTAYVGEAGPEAIASLTGVSIGVPEAVAALLDGTVPPGSELTREGEGALLPARLTLRVGGARLALTRLKWERTGAGGGYLGTGEPPPGLPVRPLSEWGTELGA